MAEFRGFTAKAGDALQDAIKTAMNLGHIYIGSEHILCGLLSANKSVAAHALSCQGVTRREVVEKITAVVGKGHPTKLCVKDFTPRSKQILEGAQKQARAQNKPTAGSEHLLRAILKDGECYAAQVLKELGVNTNALYDNCGERDKTFGVNDNDVLNFNKTSKGDVTLKKYGRELTDLARQNKLDPVIFRDNEIERVIGVLLRRRKNNPCLIGESGVGKTAIAEGLALRIAANTVPDCIKDKRIYSLDLTAMLAGAKYRGDFEERIKKAMDEIMNSRDIILFIDEIHTIIGAGAAEGAIDAANILKPLLARGEIQLIGATTAGEYRRYIEKDAALERRFQPIDIPEPSEEATFGIICGLRSRYEQHHDVDIPDETIRAAVGMSVRYINDRFLPDKAIDLIDEAASRLRLSSYSTPPALLKLSDKIREISEQKEMAVNSGCFEKAVSLRDKEKALVAQRDMFESAHALEYGFSEHSTVQVTTEDIAKIVSQMTGIPVAKIGESELEKLNQLEERLSQRVIGQSEAVSAVAKAIRRGRAGLKNPSRPIGSFLFSGSSGVGKTELCKALAEQLFGDPNALITVDMSEYMEKHAVSKLLGAPPGYVGFDEGGQITEKVRRKPYSVLLFDEMEKAHPDVLNIMLQILEEGTLTASDGRKTSFKNTVIIMTSNIGSKLITENKRQLGFSTDGERTQSDIKEKITKELKAALRPELINRFDDIIVFNSLSEPVYEKICVKMLGELSGRAEKLGFTLEFSDETIKKLARTRVDNGYGARPLRRIITAEIEDMLSQRLLEKEIEIGDTVTIIPGENGEFLTQTAKRLDNKRQSVV
ncbi:MAG: ATP-dependent Clp protease ATP-binding subunit [Oscillospiraceae bacterium]|nr:ATP-dependent Clp protease ATP-binding subunit [Oscillospiraceae bacterium]